MPYDDVILINPGELEDMDWCYVFEIDFNSPLGMGLSSVDLYNNWAVSSFNLGKTDHSIRLLKHALAMDPEHPESHYNLGIAYSSLGMFEEAQREMAMAMELRSRKQR